jgi:hypothetical protein
VRFFIRLGDAATTSERLVVIGDPLNIRRVSQQIL